MTSSPASSSSSRAKGCPWVTRCPAMAKLPTSSGLRRAGVVTHAAVEERQVGTGQDRHLVVGAEGGDPQQGDGVARDHGRRELALALRVARAAAGLLGRLRPLVPQLGGLLVERLLRRHVGPEVLPGDPAEAPEAGHQQEHPDDGQRRDRTARTPRGRRLLRIGEIIHQGLGHPAIVPASTASAPRVAPRLLQHERSRLVSRSGQPARGVPLLGRPRLDQPADDAARRRTDRSAHRADGPRRSTRLGRPGPLPPGSPAKRSGRGWLIGLIAVAVVAGGVGGARRPRPGWRARRSARSARRRPQRRRVPEARGEQHPHPATQRRPGAQRPALVPAAARTVGTARARTPRCRSAATCCSSSCRPRRPPTLTLGGRGDGRRAGRRRRVLRARRTARRSCCAA